MWVLLRDNYPVKRNAIYPPRHDGYAIFYNVDLHS